MIQLRRLPRVLVFGLSIAGFVGACGSSSHPPTNIAKKKSLRHERGETHWGSSVAAASGIRAGQYHLDLNPGSKEIILTAPGNKPYSTGQLLSGSGIKFPTLPSCKNQGTAGTGLYSYGISGTRMTITKKSDSCTARAKILTGHSWTKQ